MPKPPMFRPNTAATISVIRHAMDYAQVTLEDIILPNRRRHIMDARRALCWTLYECCYTVTEIGHIIRRDHTTVLHNIERTNDIIIYDDIYRKYCAGMLLAAERGLNACGYERAERRKDL